MSIIDNISGAQPTTLGANAFKFSYDDICYLLCSIILEHFNSHLI